RHATPPQWGEGWGEEVPTEDLTPHANPLPVGEGTAWRLPRAGGKASAQAPSVRRARPHLLELIEGAHFRPEHMHDHVSGIDKHPVAMGHAFDPRAADAGAGKVVQHAIRHGSDMPVRSA